MPFDAVGDKVHQSKDDFRRMLMQEDVESDCPIISATRNNVRVEITWDCAEGINGDYRPEDPDDEPLLRFDVMRDSGAGWEQVDDASYCTNLRAYDDRGLLQKAADLILNEVYERASIGQSIKKLCERLSHISIDKGAVHI